MFLDSISKSIQTKRDKGKPFFNQYRRKNTNQGQNKHLKQKTIKKAKNYTWQTEIQTKSLKERSYLLEKKNITNLQSFLPSKRWTPGVRSDPPQRWGERRPMWNPGGEIPMNLNPVRYEWSVVPPYHVYNIYIYNLYITGYISGHMLGGRPLSPVHKTFRMLWWMLI